MFQIVNKCNAITIFFNDVRMFENLYPPFLLRDRDSKYLLKLVRSNTAIIYKD